MKKTTPKTPGPLCQIKITLAWSKPPIWRRLVVPHNLRLDLLHDSIQRVMPWTNSHLHQFEMGRKFYGVPHPEMSDFGSETLNEKKFTLADLAPAPKSKFTYEYDFGDGWLHQIVLEKLLPPDAAFKQPVCLAGANACPPDDCGGIPGYYNLLEILADPKNPEHDDMMDWIGGSWDAAHFDLDETNASFRGFQL